MRQDKLSIPERQVRPARTRRGGEGATERPSENRRAHSPCRDASEPPPRGPLDLLICHSSHRSQSVSPARLIPSCPGLNASNERSSLGFG